MNLSTKEVRELKTNPARFIDKAIKKYTAGSPLNRLPDYNNEPVIEEPLVGFADGYDPIFKEFKKDSIIGSFHLTPLEAFNVYSEKQKKEITEKQPTSLSVISIGFTFPEKTRLSNQPNSRMAAPRWNSSYGLAFQLMAETLSNVVSLLESAGYHAVAPVCTRPLPIKTAPDGLPYSDWSEKHAAYAAGMGTFGLHTSLITPAGVAVHLGNIITDLAVKASPRKYDNYLGYCLHFINGSCSKCAARCPAGAVNTQSFEGKKCLEYTTNDLRKLIREAEGVRPPDHPVCALCQIGVPCEAGIPAIKQIEE
jgi:epoxyqueuosine reductase